MALERQELGEILRFQESLLRLVTMSRQEPDAELPPKRPVSVEAIVEMARQVAQAS